MSGESYDRDVQRLITEFEDVLRGMKQERIVEKTPSGYIGRLSITIDNCEKALAPFRPDPEEELIEAMAKSMYLSDSPAGTWETSSVTKPYQNMSRAALQVVKEKGYFNDQR